MQIECAFFGPLRDAVDEKTVVYDTDAETAGDLLRELENEYSNIRQLVDGDELADGIAVTINKRHLSSYDGLSTTLADGDVVRLTTAVYGG